eukprot:SM000014S00300  [mRNA]  locus=s14:542916:544368:- [translate_table: standard]
MACPFELTADGHELQFATNHLGSSQWRRRRRRRPGHFLLTSLLLPMLKASADASGAESRVVVVASMAHKLFPVKGGIDFDNINDKRRYLRTWAYGQSKLANILHARRLQVRGGASRQSDGVTNVTVNVLCPGSISTKLQRHLGPAWASAIFKLPFQFLLKSIPQGAATTCYVATSPTLAGVSSKYFTDCNENGASSSAMSHDDGLAKRLWEYSEQATSLCTEQAA